MKVFWLLVVSCLGVASQRRVVGEPCLRMEVFCLLVVSCLGVESGGKFGSIACEWMLFGLLLVSCLGVAQPTAGDRQRAVGSAKGIWEHFLRTKAFYLLVDGIGGAQPTVGDRRRAVGGARGIWEHCLRMEAFCLLVVSCLGVPS